MKYYIVEKDALSTYGSSDGIDSVEEVEKLLTEAEEDVERLMVIQGSQVEFTICHKVTLLDNVRVIS